MGREQNEQLVVTERAGAPPKTVRKAFAYIRRGAGLLVFEHANHPEAGLQVPAGTIAVGETAAAAVVREAYEETGLRALSPPVLLGVTEFDARPFGKAELHLRHFFRCDVIGSVPERWRHYERDAADGLGEAIAFDFFWLPFGVAEARLVADHGSLIRSMEDAARPGPRQV